MKTLAEKSHTRVTLALDIVRKITEGPLQDYHELTLIKHRIGLFDTITVEEAKTTRVICNDPRVPLDGTNICVRALDSIKKAAGIDKNVVISLQKRIPVMGGLAGGSANAATMLRLLDSLWELGLGDKRLMEIGRSLGMDVPYFFSGKTALDTEAGGILEPIATACQFDFLLVVPDFGVSTKEAYAHIDYGLVNKKAAVTAAMREALESGNCSEAVKNIHNDFELSVFKRYPPLAAIKERLLELGCLNAAMTGSGSTMLGIVDRNADTNKIKREIGYTTLEVSTLK